MLPLLAALVVVVALPMLLLLLIVTPSMPTALKSPKTPLPSLARGDDVDPAADVVGAAHGDDRELALDARLSGPDEGPGLDAVGVGPAADRARPRGTPAIGKRQSRNQVAARPEHDAGKNAGGRDLVLAVEGDLDAGVGGGERVL